VTQLRTHAADSDGVDPASQTLTLPPVEERPAGPIERVMSTVIRRLSWSKLANPKVAVTVSGVGLLLGMLVGATAPNTETLPIKVGLSRFFPSLAQDNAVTMALLYTGTILACLGLAGMLWAHSQGWRPDPRRLLLVSAAVVAVMVSLTPVGSSDVASYAAYGRIAVLGGNPYTTNPAAWLGAHAPYTEAVGYVWKTQSSVYGPIATVIQAFAAWLGGPSPAATIWLLMIFNGAAFIGLGYLLLKTSDDPVRATLFWVANPVLLLALVAGGQIDTLVAVAAICSIQVARRFSGPWGDVLVGVLIGIGCGIKVTAVLIGLGLAWPLLRRREWRRTALMAAAALATVAFEYSFSGLNALKPVVGGTRWINFPSPWRLFQMAAEALGVHAGTTSIIITCLWPIAMLIVAWLIYQRISSDQPREIVAPFALAFAWVLVAPWVFAWYTALAWATLSVVPRNRMTRWLTLVTVFLALWLSAGGQAPPGKL
jgi:Glycosyltransferase family 87